MPYNLFDSLKDIDISRRCFYDSKAAYTADLSVDGSVDGWDDYYGVHTYGCFNGFLFGTVFYVESYIGRTTPFLPVDAGDFYILKISMKTLSKLENETLNGKVMWRTITNPTWNDTNTYNFKVINDGKWHDYNLHMGEVYGWQGDVNDLRIFPMLDGINNDEFFIKNISIESITKKICTNGECSYHSKYKSPCKGIGEQGYIISDYNDIDKFTIEKGVNDLLVININDYGDEHISIDDFEGSGKDLANKLRDKISEIDIGGYADCNVKYLDSGQFIIYSGTYANDSTVYIKDTDFSRYIKFYDDKGKDISEKHIGKLPASKYIPYSTFTVPINKIVNLFKNKATLVEFNPDKYRIEGGRSDWLNSGLGANSYMVNSSGSKMLDSMKIDNEGKTIIDICHPFNSSGRINKISLQGTLIRDDDTFLSGAKILIMRPHLNGDLTVIHELSIDDVPTFTGILYSKRQEQIEVECDVFVNKGDLLAVYNAFIYAGKSAQGGLIDALYYHIDYKPQGRFNPGKVYGEGSSGLLIHARSEEKQSRLSIDIDLGHRVNIEDMEIGLKYESSILEYNIARCLDIDWYVELFNQTYKTGYKRDNNNGTFTEYDFVHENKAYGLYNLNDGIKILNGNVTSDAFTVSSQESVTPNSPNYFFINGDEEWLGVHHHVGNYIFGQYVRDFETDPIAFDIIFPHGSFKTIHRTAVYFKENFNFRTFSLQYYVETPSREFLLIPEYKSVTLDGTKYDKLSSNYGKVDLFLFSNPSEGGMVRKAKDGSPWAPEKGGGYIDNNDQNLQALQLDWTVLEHEFEPIKCRGFRFRSDYHESTKVNEMELYCVADESSDNVVGSFSIDYSYYMEDWYKAEITEDGDKLIAFIGDTPRYLNINIEPFRSIDISNIYFGLSESNVYIGKKGCDDIILLDDNKIDSVNKANKITLKNIYGSAYNLSVDIPNEIYREEYGLILYSKMNNMESITHPEIGPDCVINLREDYLLKNENSNCAINGYCYSLKNLIDGKEAYSSYDNGFMWNYEGELHSNEFIDFSNIKDSSITILEVPTTIRSKYWKIAHRCQDLEVNIREIRVFSEGELLKSKFYYDKEQDLSYGAISDPAPHLSNYSVQGSYYRLKRNNYIGIELEGPISIDKIVIYHDKLDMYYTTGKGIDCYTNFMLHSDIEFRGQDIYDYSYNEIELDYIGPGVYSAGVSTLFPITYSTDFDEDPMWDLLEMGLGTTYTVSSGIMDFKVLSMTKSSDRITHRFDLGYVVNRDCVFEFTFDILLHSYSDGQGIAVGLIEGGHEGHSYVGGSHTYAKFEGVTALFYPSGSVTLMVNSKRGPYNYNYDETASSDGFQYDLKHYCRMYSNGKGSFGLEVYNDYLYGNKIIDLFIEDAYYVQWKGYTIGIGSAGYGSVRSSYTIDETNAVWTYGQISHFNFDSYVLSDAFKNGRRAIKFEGGYENKLEFKRSEKFEPTNRAFFIDFWLLIDELPKLNSHCYIIKNMIGDPLAGTGFGGGWYLAITNEYGIYYIILRYYYSSGSKAVTLKHEFKDLTLNRWYHIGIIRDMYTGWSGNCYTDLFVDGLNYEGVRTGPVYVDITNKNLEIGVNFKGMISDLRFSVSPENDTKLRIRSYSDYRPEYAYERLYTFSLYNSDDNIYYGKFIDLDALYKNVHSYYDEENKFSDIYYSFFMIDLGKTYKLDFLRNYGESTALQIDLLHHTLCMSDKTDDVYALDIEENDPEIRYNIIQIISMEGASGEDNIFSDFNYYDTGWAYRPWIGFILNKPMCPNKLTFYNTIGFSNRDLVNVQLQGSNDDTYNWENKEWTVLMEQGVGNLGSGGTTNELLNYGIIEEKFKYIRLIYYSDSNSNMRINNLKIYEYKDFKSARWLGIKLLNGDGVARKVSKLGVYPDITQTYSIDGGYNSEWEYIGNSITNYLPDENLALNKPIDVTSTFETLNKSFLNDGYIGTEMYESWGSDNDAHPYIKIDLEDIYEIYRIKIYHNYTDENKDFIPTNYSIYSSTDDEIYERVFDISKNDSTIRTHDLEEIKSMRYIRVQINSFESKRTYMRVGRDYKYFHGVFIRQIQVFKYKNFDVLNSEETPVIATNLRHNFYIDNIYSIGRNAEDTSLDWLVDNPYDITYSNSLTENPNKIEFRPWASEPGYDRWVVIKNKNAEYSGDGVRYIKRLVVSCSTDINPCDYYWWWSTEHSNLYNSYTNIDAISTKSLVIDYQGNGAIDDVYYIGGDSFGVDEDATWRDGLALYWYIENLSDLDTSFGYIYLYGLDYTNNKNKVVYKWNINNLTSYISSGWNYLFLRFRSADGIEHTENEKEPFNDVRTPKKIEFTRVGINFRGVNNSLFMILNGFEIERNKFKDQSTFDTGFYMSGKDIISYPLSKFNIYKGTIEFWMRPDFDGRGIDFYGEYKYRTLFSFSNNSNDIFGAMISHKGLGVYYGNSYDDSNIFYVGDKNSASIDTLYHVAVVYSCNGKNTSDGSTIIIYMNGSPVARHYEKWEVTDIKNFKFFIGGQAFMSVKEGYIDPVASSFDSVVSEFKVYDFCKEDFSDSLVGRTEEYDIITQYTDKLIEISKDNVNFYKAGDKELPFLFKHMQPNEKVDIYVRSNLPRNVKEYKNRVNNLVLTWDVAV